MINSVFERPSNERIATQFHLPGGLVRNYSLVDWAHDGSRVSVAVKLDPAGRGGSAAMHALTAGTRLDIASPRNNFPIRPGEDGGPGRRVLVAGGIGITPLYAMARHLQSSGQPFDLHYLVRSRPMAAFDHALRDLGLNGSHHLHCDDTDGFADFTGLLAAYPEQAHVYVCGPESMLHAVLEASEAVRSAATAPSSSSGLPRSRRRHTGRTARSRSRGLHWSAVRGSRRGDDPQGAPHRRARRRLRVHRGCVRIVHHRRPRGRDRPSGFDPH